MKIEIESRHSDYGPDAGGYSVLRIDGVWIGRIESSEGRKAVEELIVQSKKPSLDLAGRIYGLQEAAVIAGETSIGLAIYERIKFLEANHRTRTPQADKEAE
jgi:hypothetical protein